ncbi:MAG: BCCT family transporter [Pseudomonadota bacterium]
MPLVNGYGRRRIFLHVLKWTRPWVFWPPVALLLLALGFSLIDFDGFHARVSAANNWILSRFDWLFSFASFAAVLLLIWVVASPLGKVRIGGPDAKPILKRWNWFAITLCTTIAIGILFWGTAEPMFHVNSPPDFAGVDARSDGAARFALSSLFMHWTITPYAIYTVPALAFALAHYNLGRPYSLSGPLSLIFGRVATGRGGDIIDAIGLYALVVGVAASLGAGVMTITGGLDAIAGFGDGAFWKFLITLAIVALFVASSISGIQRGIKYLSDINIRFFFALCAFIFIAGPTLAIVSLGGQGLVEYFVDFIPRSLALGERAGDPWTRDWTVFYFANWLAWAPITALFLGRISVGYTVREFLVFNLAAPAAFGALWMTVFGGAAIEIDVATNGSLTEALNSNGPEAVIYALFSALPLAGLVAIVFVTLTFISFVTAMDSNTHSITGVCLKQEAPGGQHGQSALFVKVFWGALVGAVAWVMTATTGIDGVRMLSNLGGLPGLFILIAMGAVVVALQTVWFEEIRAARQPADELTSS